MVNDQYMGKEQIPVVVGGKTYFGCCAMCKEKLEKNEAARMAVDPVSGARVDKATAVIGRDASNKVYYFENEQTMRRFTL
jgi:YHS domain-containing protein